jgi:multidrug transporter EmrE-like cation transporter
MPMSLSSLAIVLLSVTLSALGQICFKFGLNSVSHSGAPAGGLQNVTLALLTPGVVAGLGFYAVGTLLWLSALGRLELSQAYPFVSVGFALTTLGGWWLFSDQLSIQRIIGIAIIMFGILLVAKT